VRKPIYAALVVSQKPRKSNGIENLKLTAAGLLTVEL
jgi:hypothetical protein